MKNVYINDITLTDDKKIILILTKFLFGKEKFMKLKKEICLIVSLALIFSCLFGTTSMAAATSNVTQINLKGLGDETFSLIQYDSVKKAITITTSNVQPHVYFDSTYASLKLVDDNGNVKFTKEYIGNKEYISESKKFSIEYGDRFYISHAEHTRIDFYDYTNKKNLNIAPTQDYVETEYILMKSGMQRVDTSDYQIQMEGLGDIVFAYLNYNSSDSTLTIITKPVAPHVYFNESYASIKIVNASGRVKYFKDYVGNVKQDTSTKILNLASGDRINIYYAEASRLKFFNGQTDVTNSNNLKPSANKVTTSYITSQNGFKLASDTVTAKKVTRNALVIGNLNSEPADTNNINYMVKALKQSDFDGEKINVNSLKNPTMAQFKTALKETFTTSTDDSVNYLMIGCHGANSYLALCTDGAVTGSELRDMLDEIPGKFILVIDACYSGSLIQPAAYNLYDESKILEDIEVTDEESQQFSNDLVDAFAPSIFARNAELAAPKYTVLCASTKDNPSYYGKYSFVFKAVADSGTIDYSSQIQSNNFPADANKDGKCTFKEIIDYCKPRIGWELAYYADDDNIVCFQQS